MNKRFQSLKEQFSKYMQNVINTPINSPENIASLANEFIPLTVC